MIHFIKWKRSTRPERRICDHCRTRAADVHIRSIRGGGSQAGRSVDAADWWLCSTCAAMLRPDDPASS